MAPSATTTRSRSAASRLLSVCLVKTQTLPARHRKPRPDKFTAYAEEGGPVASYTTILVGTDGSESSFRAVEQAAAVAADSGATLLIVSAYTEMSDRERSRASSALGAESYTVVGSHPADDILRDAADRAKKVGAGKVDTFCKSGDPVDVLVEAIEERKADLCVVGNRGLTSLAGRLLGSVPANISHRAACDVLIVHTTSGRAR